MKMEKDEECKRFSINFCVKCFKGFMILDFHQKKGWAIKCEHCKQRIQMLEGAMKVSRED